MQDKRNWRFSDTQTLEGKEKKVEKTFKEKVYLMMKKPFYMNYFFSYCRNDFIVEAVIPSY